MKKKVVIVEDEHPIANAQKIILEDEFDVHLVHHGDEAMNVISGLKPEVVVLDWMLPGKNGVEICEELKSNTDLKDTKVVMVTAKNTDHDEMYGLDAGADDYIMKPFEPVELLHVLKQVLKND